MYLFSMTKKMNQFLRHFIIGERIFLWFNISPSSFPFGIVLVAELAESRLYGFAVAFDRLAESLAFNLNAFYSNCTSGISVSLLFKFITNLFDP